MLRLSADPCIVGIRRDLGELEEVTTELQRKEAVGEAQRWTQTRSGTRRPIEVPRTANMRWIL